MSIIKRFPGGGTVELETTWIPGEDPDAAAAALVRLSDYVGDTFIPLQESAQILENDIRNRFDTETDPGGLDWVDLTEDWAERKQEDSRFLPIGDSPSGDYILRLTGELYETATDPSRFHIGEDTLVYDPSGLPEYGLYHQTGTNKIPSRPFIGISIEAQMEIEADFAGWIDIGVEEFGTSTTVRKRIPKGQPGAGRFTR